MDDTPPVLQRSREQDLHAAAVPPVAVDQPQHVELVFLELRFGRLAGHRQGDGHRFLLQLVPRHAPCNALADLRQDARDPSPELTPACPFCTRRDRLSAVGTVAAWPGSTLYRCSRCRTEWAVAP